jgi:transposase
VDRRRRLSADQRRFVDHLLVHSEPARTARDLTVDFGRVFRERDVTGLAKWLTKATASDHAEFRDLAAGLRRDIAAVEAAVRERWSNGQTEGHVNKRKTLKRQMDGRASLGLLRQRLLAA